jgi:hypothetical protein
MGRPVIHYHGTPMTPVRDMVTAFATRHAMVSFEHPEQVEIVAEVCQSFVLDNGAFSAWKSGAAYDFAGYVEWAGKWLKHPACEWAVIPDVIDGDEATNDAQLAAWPFPAAVSVPVYHFHESLERLARLVAAYPRVALGSSGVYRDPGSDAWWKRVCEIMPVCCDADGWPRVKLHGLRMLDPGIFSKLPLASADSTNVARNVGIDQRWRGTYVPQSRAVRAQILIDRIERHASAAYWSERAVPSYQNMELFG